MHNVYGRLRGSGSGKCLLVSADSDTVFTAETDLTVRRDAGRIFFPGIGDHALGVVALAELPRLLDEAGVSPARDLWLIANVCEEGQGDLSGVRVVMDRFGRSLAAWIVLG